MNEKIPGIFIPPSVISRLENATDPKAECVALASGMIRELKPHVQGVHLMAIGWEELVPQVIASSGI